MVSEGIQPIIGMQVNIADSPEDELNIGEVILIAKNETGYKNLLTEIWVLELGYGNFVTEIWLLESGNGNFATGFWLRDIGYWNLVTEIWLREFGC